MNAEKTDKTAPKRVIMSRRFVAERQSRGYLVMDCGDGTVTWCANQRDVLKHADTIIRHIMQRDGYKGCVSEVEWRGVHRLRYALRADGSITRKGGVE